jgi:myotubularin-related protein 6/7/8
MKGVLNAPDLGYDKWAGAIESSEWLKHIRNIMDAVSLIVKSIVEENANVLIHCSDGWDEKEWVFSGHKFMDRSGHVAKNPRSSGYKESAPIFHQFLECTWQILRCYPTEFEFQESFLIEIFEHLYSCQFGNFLLNCESDRESRQLRERTRSLWPYLESRRHIHLNPIYSPSPSNEIINWTPGAQSIAFWTGLYYRFDEEAKIADPFVECSYSI